MNEHFSKEELIARGWKAAQIDAVLDRADEFGPSGHWLNRTGKPYYLQDRVEVAAYRVGLASERPEDSLSNKWVFSEKPTSRPELTVDFHRLAEAVKEGASQALWSLRLCHPVLGRRPGTRESEKVLIEESLMALIARVFGPKLKTSDSLDRFLLERSTGAAQSLGPNWPATTAVRVARRAGYVSVATGEKAMRRSLDALALVHAGVVKSWDGRKLNLVEFLQYAPKLRFDSQVIA